MQAMWAAFWNFCQNLLAKRRQSLKKQGNGKKTAPR
jgi:hypothetical protein